MTRSNARQLCCVACGLTLITGTLNAAPPEVKDAAHAFSAEAVARANHQLIEIAKHYDVKLIIEYAPSVPGSSYWEQVKKKILEYKQPASRRGYYTDWARRNVRAAGPDCIYILVCKDPAPIQVEVAIGQNLRRHRKFTEADADKLRERLQELFQSGQNDEALAVATGSVRETLQANLAAQITPAEDFHWTRFLSVIGILTALYLGLLVFHRAQPGLPASASFATDLYRVANDHWIRRLAVLFRSGDTGVPVALPATEHPDEAALRYDQSHLERQG